jgi:hypothetical protein
MTSNNAATIFYAYHRFPFTTMIPPVFQLNLFPTAHVIIHVAQFIFVMGATEHSQFKKLAKSFSANSKESFPLFAVVAPAEAPYKSEALTVLSLAPYEITAESVFRFLQT